MNNYRQWVASNIKEEKTAGEMYNAIEWMERCSDQISELYDNNETHPGVQFSRVIDRLIDGIKDKENYREIIVKWIVENKKVPFGKILKTKAMRKLWKHSNRISANQIEQLKNLHDKLKKLEYPPTETKWLVRLIEKRS